MEKTKKRRLNTLICMMIFLLSWVIVISACADSIPERLLNTTYKKGMNTKEVLEIKQKMQEQGYFKAGAELSGNYNDLMVERIMLFQKDHGLKQTGIIDVDFLKALYNSTASIPERLLNTTYKKGMNTKEVLEIKQKMQEQGYFKAGAELSGNYNDLMVERIMLFQKDHGLKQTGIIDVDFLKALYNSTATVSLSNNNIIVGSTITLGQYEQDNRSSNGKEPIEWQVLAVDGNRALVISCYALDAVSYGKPMDVNEYSRSGVSWKTSYLRTWLNDTFYNATFSSQEKKQILSVDLTTQDASGTVQTTDRVFVLSVAEVDKYFRSTKEMACKVTAYGESKLKTDAGAINSDGYCFWWLRDMTSIYKQADRTQFMQTTYNEAGNIDNQRGTALAKEGKGVPIFCDYLISVRPAMWIQLDIHNSANNSQMVNQTSQPTAKPTAKPTVKPTAKPTATPKPKSVYMSDTELIEMAKGYFYLHGGSENGITGTSIEHQGDTSYVYIAYNYTHCYVVKLNRKTGLGLGMSKMF